MLAVVRPTPLNAALARPQAAKSMRLNSISRLFAHDAAGGVVLIVAALVALAVANSPFELMYAEFLDLKLTIAIGTWGIAKPLLLWINDGLMAVFFFLIGLEVKREVLDGELSSASKIALPGCAALGGFAVPATRS